MEREWLHEKATNPRALINDPDIVKDLRTEIGQLRKSMQLAQKMLEVPAAEYVPAINDAWEELQRGLNA